MSAPILAFALVVLVTCAVVAFAIHRRRSRPVAGLYESTKPLSEPEQALYWRLKEAMPECIVLGQVSFSRFLLPKSASTKTRRALFLRISQKTVDFLVCLPDFTVVAAVELDDKSHSTKKDVRRDEILQSAGVTIVRLNVNNIPSAQELRAAFTK